MFLITFPGFSAFVKLPLGLKEPTGEVRFIIGLKCDCKAAAFEKAASSLEFIHTFQIQNSFHADGSLS